MLVACTVAGRHQLPEARVLADSLGVLEPPVRLFVLVVDHGAEVDPVTEPFVTVLPPELDLSRFEMLAGIHALVELAEIVRPALLRHVLERSGGPVLSLDIDMQAFGSLSGLAEVATRHAVTLVPRLLRAVSRDHVRLPDEDLIKLGVFDRGACVVTAGEEVDHLLRLWSDRLELDSAEERPLPTARFLDLAPGLVESCAIVRDPGLSVGVVNLHERHVTQDAGFFVNGVPLRLVHFNGLDGSHRPLDDPFGGPMDRQDPPEHDWDRAPDGLREAQQRELVLGNPALLALLSERARLVSAAGGDQPVEYAFARLADGTPLSRRLRRGVRDAERYGGLTGSPFSVSGTTSLLDWLAGPGERGGSRGVSRYWFEIYVERRDLQVTFPDLDGADAAGFLQWAARTGREQYATPDPLMPAGAS